MTALLLVALGGAVGAVLRFVTDGEVKARYPGTWPMATFTINVLGSFVLGVLGAFGPSASLMALVGTGVCGGFTTFSTASVETVTLARSRSAASAVGYAACTLAACTVAYALGAAL